MIFQVCWVNIRCHDTVSNEHVEQKCSYMLNRCSIDHISLYVSVFVWDKWPNISCLTFYEVPCSLGGTNRTLAGTTEIKFESGICRLLALINLWMYTRCSLVQHIEAVKMAISQSTFSNAFSSMKRHKFQLRFHWGLFPWAISTVLKHWFG